MIFFILLQKNYALTIISMKKSVLLFYVLLGIITLSSCADNVYICTGGYSRRFHRTEYCKGLRNCSGIVKKLTKKEAIDMYKTPCHICYSEKYREYYNK